MPIITASDRLGLTLFFAIVLHALGILGISFTLTDREHRKNPAQQLEITLVTRKDEKAPDQAEYLAQADHQGKGNVRERKRPTAPLAQPTAESASRTGTTPERRTATAQPRKTQIRQRELLTSKQPDTRIRVQKKEERTAARSKPSAAELINRGMEIASLDAEVRQRHEAYAKRPRVKYISANTRAYKYATYMEAWRAKVERIGRLNYPEEAKRRKLSGSLRLDVALNADGTVSNIVLRHSSGIKLLDDAAIRIVKLAAPFAPFPDAIRKETDILHIQRTWIFKSGNQLVAR